MAYNQSALYPPASAPYHGGNGYSHSTDSYLAIPDEKFMNASYKSSFDEEPKTGWGKKQWLILGGCLLLVAAIAGGVAGGVIASKNKSSSSSSSSQSGTSSNDGGTGSGGSASDSSFAKDSRLHQSFAGMCYSPPNAAFYPNCGDTTEAVVRDIQLMSQLTSSLRTYGADCNTSALVLDAIDRTGVNMSVYLGIYFDTDPAVFTRQLQTTLDVLTQYGVDHVDGIIVGNEYILNAYTSVTGSAAATRAQTAAQRTVIANIATVRQAVTALRLSKTVPIGTADAGSMITTQLAQASDFIMANVHPFFSGVGITEAAGWTWDYLETDTPSVALRAPNRPTLFASEVGWPSGAAPNGSLSLNGSSASLEHTQYFLDNYLCASNTNQTKYFWFEAFDEAWKNSVQGGAESHWGLFNSDRTLKDLTIPNCAVDYSMTTAR